jgi:hypothetical protein
MHFKRIEIMGDCDPDNLGIENKGEFSYRVAYSLQDSDGSWTERRTVSQTAHYGTNGSAAHEKKSDDGVFTIDKTVAQSLEEGLHYRMYGSAIEWDASLMDSRMNNDTATEENASGGGTLTYRHKLDLGSGQCKVRLYVNVDEDLVQ